MGIDHSLPQLAEVGHANMHGNGSCLGVKLAPVAKLWVILDPVRLTQHMLCASLSLLNNTQYKTVGAEVFDVYIVIHSWKRQMTNKGKKKTYLNTKFYDINICIPNVARHERRRYPQNKQGCFVILRLIQWKHLQRLTTKNISYYRIMQNIVRKKECYSNHIYIWHQIVFGA